MLRETTEGKDVGELARKVCQKKKSFKHLHFEG